MSRRRVTVRAGALSLRADLRVLDVLAVAAAATLAAFTVHVGRGEFAIAPPDVLAALAGAGDQATSFIVLELRLPRALDRDPRSDGAVGGRHCGIEGWIRLCR